MFNLILFGPPGAGKGTQSAKLIDKYNFVHISTGDLFREHISNDTELGKKVKSILAEGQLVPDSVTIEMLEDTVIKHPEAKGFIFDGFPRTVPQAEALDIFVQKNNQKINLVLQLDVSEEELKKRIAKRRETSGRADDDEEKLVKRMEEYFNKTIKVLPYYESQGRLVKIEGLGEIGTIFKNLCSEIDKKM